MTALAYEFGRLLWQARADPRRADAIRVRAFRRFVRDAIAPSPFHRARCQAAGVRPSDLRTPSDLAALPIMERADLADSLREILTTSPTPRLRQLRTSGSSGAPLTVWLTRREQRARQALQLRARWLAGRRPLQREAVIGSAVPPRSRWPRIVRRSLYLSALEDPERIAGLLRSFAPEYIVAFPSTLLELGDEPGVRPRLITTGAEVLEPEARRTIERRFAAPIRDIYGAIETGLLAFQCAVGDGYHLNADEVHVEWVPGAAGDGAPDMIVTPLFARATPLVRYRLGDIVEPLASACPCGSWLPRIARVDGRRDDWLVRPDGRKVPPAAVRALFRRDDVAQFRITQTGNGSIALELVTTGACGEELVAALSSLTGVPVRLELCTTLSRDPSGKRRAVRRLAGPLEARRPGE